MLGIIGERQVFCGNCGITIVVINPPRQWSWREELFALVDVPELSELLDG